jgi:hypothetical protein
MTFGKSIKIQGKLKILFVSLIFALIIIYSPLTYSQNNQPDSQFNSLQKTLISYGFTVKIELPPYQTLRGIRPYGVVSSKTKTIWINPVVFDLGNAQPTLIHEATHAAQLCIGKGAFKLLNLSIEPPKITHPYFLRYHQNYQREIEAEAYTVQVQPNSLELVEQLLDRYCSPAKN